MTTKKIILILVLTAIMFCLSLFRVENSVCCMFASNRERGFPCKVLLISKGTDSGQEADKVYYLNDLELLKQGWKLRAGSIFDPPLLVIPINLIFYFVVSWAAVSIIEQVKRIYDKK
jgi:hypothetical protein